MKVQCLPFQVLFLALITFSIAQCPSTCRFKLCNVGSGAPSSASRRIQLRAPGIAPQGPVICRKKTSDSTRRILTTGEPIVKTKKGSPQPLNTWKPDGLSPTFADKFFGVGDVPVYEKSSITRKAFFGNQPEFIDSVCIQIPILSYERFDKRTGKVKVVKTKGSKKDCVSFRPRPNSLMIELEWVGRDDLDLFVKEPNGDVISKFNRKSDKGTFKLDVNAGQCFNRRRLSGKERAFYESTADSGTYTVTVRHFENCEDGPTDWKLRVTREGKLILNESGSDDGDFSSLVLEKTFTK